MGTELTEIANRIWGRLASQLTPNQLSFEAALYKRFVDIFHVGPYFYSIFNYARNDFDLVAPQVELIVGYQSATLTIPFLISCIHPEDIPCFLNFENRAMDFLKGLPINDLVHYKIMHDYRFRKANGNYVRLLQQGIVLEHDEQGKILRTLIVHTDIEHLKPAGLPILSFIGLEERPSFINVKAEEMVIPRNDVLTKREKQILRMLMDGKLSKEIATELAISKLTVDRHRKNMLQKTGLRTTAELITKAVTNGWLS